MTHTSVRSRLSNKDEKVIDFCENFDSIIKEYETYEDAVTFTEREKSFYHTVASIIPELRSADLILRQTQMKEMNLEKIKLFFYSSRQKRRLTLNTKLEFKENMEIVSKQLKTSDTGAMVQGTVLNNVSLRILINGFAMCVKP